MKPEFGFPDRETRVFAVSELAGELKKFIENEARFQGCWIRGETSRVTYHSSGHLYFSLKDDRSVVSAVMWRAQVEKSKFQIKEGMEILVLGNLTTYPARGNYQIVAKEIIPEGLGKLQQKIEELKIALMKEGLFDSSKKIPIPFLPKKVGVITSPTGAAFRDIVRVLRSRYPNVDILLIPSDVQGDMAVRSILRAIEEARKPFWRLDVVIIARGGGSLEDLMAFNEESVVRAISGLTIPKITGIGHEIDFTLSDFVADRSGATPSQAAQIAVPESREIREKIDSLYKRQKILVNQKLDFSRQLLEKLKSNRLLSKPQNYINELVQSVDDSEDRMVRAMNWQLRQKKHLWESYKNFPELIKARLSGLEKRFELIVERMEGRSPIRAISRGYSFLQKQNGKIVTRKEQVKIGESLSVRIVDAILDCKIEKIEEIV